MSDPEWQKQGATFSHNNACKEFGLTEEEVIDAMNAGKLQYRQNYAHGNPYYRLLRAEVESFALERHGSSYLEKKELEHKLKNITKEINSLKRKLPSLERQQKKLIEQINIL